MLNVIALALGLASIAPGKEPASTLRDLANARRLNLGSCAMVDGLRNDIDGGDYVRTLTSQFNFLEPENDFKPPALWLGLGKYNWQNADFLLGEPGKKGWAEQHHMKVRGHVLVYARDEGYTIPRWLIAQESSITPEQAKQILHEYITTVVGRYKGKVAFWDVANEAIDDRPNGNPFNLRNSFWFRKLGPEFLVLAFQFAREADRRVELYYNEYGIESGGRKADDTLALLDWMRSKGAPVTGLGLQWHISAGTSVKPGDGHYAVADRLQAMKFAFMVTELDVAVPVVVRPRSDPSYGMTPRDMKDLDVQAETYKAVFEYALAHRNCHGINIWGFTDLHNWIPGFSRGANGAATIFDGHYAPKPAVAALAATLSR